MNKKIVFAITAFFIYLAPTPHCQSADGPPNVVLIFADDLGYGDLGCYGATKVQTPNIDALAADGRRFTDAHSVSAVCTPSRYALLTGQYPVRANDGRGVWGPAPITSKLIVDTNKTTIADVFKSAGYEAGVIGKWHLGFGEGTNKWQEPLRPGPQDLGFDYYFGMPVVNSAPPYVYVENDRVVGSDSDDPLVLLGRNAKGITPITPIPPEAAQRSPNQFGGAKKAHALFNDYQVGTTLAKKSVEWINEHKDKPFFLYLATTNIHHPFTPAKRFQGTSGCGLYGDFIHELDWIVGEVMTCLEENGVADNTLVIFTSDNGGMFNLGGQAAFKAGHRQNGDLLGFKFGVWEGGHRVPMIVRWPGRVKAGTTSDQLIGNVDMLATFAALTGQKIGKAQQADSVNMLPAFVDEPEEQIRDHLVLAPHKGTHLSVRKGKWMYIPNQGSGGFGGKKPGDHTFAGPAAATFVGSVNSDIEDGKIRQDAPPAQLYDLEADVNETQNVHDENPEVVKELKALLALYRSGIRQNSPKQGKQKRRTSGEVHYKPAKKTPAIPSNSSASFDFESGTLAPWRIIEGEFGHIIGSRDRFFHNQGEYNKQGEHYLTTLEASTGAEKGSDPQTGIVVSPLFIPELGKMTFRVGGGDGPNTYAALCTADGEEVQFARGIRDQVMQQCEWDLSPYAGKKMFIKIVDNATGGWGHITADDFQFDGKVFDEYPTASSGIRQNSKSKSPELKGTSGEVHYSKTEGVPSFKPNFVVIFTDDQGYGDLSCYEADHVSTPRIDQMAKEGSRLTSFYVAAPVCTPSRAGLMTGCYPKRVGMATGSNFGVLLAGDTKGLNPEEMTIAEVLKSAGYKTGMFGKWHLGDQPDFLPTRQGFDEFFGLPYSHDIHPFHPRQDRFNFPPLPVLDGDTVIEMDPDADYLTKRITERAVSFIELNKDVPFFLYVPHPIPHAPLHVSSPFMEGVADEVVSKLKDEVGKIDYRTRDELFRQAIAEIDWSVGTILDTLKANGLDEKTLVIFTSDNGPPKNTLHASPGPLRGHKGTTFEGGMREPTVIRWPGMIPAGHDNNELMTTMDLLPTFAKLAGAELPTDRIIDGKDIWPTLVGQSPTPHEAFFYHQGNSLTAVRSGKWKLHTNKGRPMQLYNLDDDIGEMNNVIEAHPEVVKQLNNHLHEFANDIANNSRPAAFAENPRPLSKGAVHHELNR
ncbi:sulfatase-like hydrolase/transferase [Roseiconus lacunae]|uniref:sulfatase-like hydrolase/transferase n=1 Tax=Roseiconus lacunae TaxID=2605694 RepID=UPI001F1F8DA0|nr:sulfatase-like hydrolase/transferase [Roseiconus lacunae]